MNFEYSKTKKQKQEMIKKNIVKKQQFTNQLNTSNLLLKNNPSNSSEHLDLFSNLLDGSNDEPSNLNEENTVMFSIKNINMDSEQSIHFSNIEGSNHVPLNYNDTSSVNVLFNNSSFSNDTQHLPLSIINHREVDRRKPQMTQTPNEFSFGNINNFSNGIGTVPIENFNGINSIIKINKTTKNNPSNPSNSSLNIGHNIKIINIYQTDYMNGNAQGLGDFLRGSYYLIQFCEKYNYIYEIDLSRHLLCHFLKKLHTHENKQRGNLSNVYKFDNINSEFLIGEKNEIQFKISNNYKFFEHFLKNQKIINDTITLYTNSFPILPIKMEDKKYMRSILEPTDEIIETSKKILERINLMNKPFTIIHIRYGDDYLVHNEKKFNLENLEKLKSEINNLPKSENYLLLADNNPIKRYIINQFPFIKTFFKEISHSGEKVNEINKIKNTMVEFYLMSYSKKILNYSSYLHGSGFSKWCAVTYDIPYKSKYIN